MTNPADANQAVVVVPDSNTDIFTALLDHGLISRICTLIEAQYDVRLLYCHSDTNIANSCSIAGYQIPVDRLPESEPPSSIGPMSPVMLTCRQVYEHLRALPSVAVILGCNRDGLLYYAQSAKKQGLAFQQSIFEISLCEPQAVINELEGMFCNNYSDSIKSWLEKQTLAMADRILSSSTFLSEWLKLAVPEAPLTVPLPIFPIWKEVDQSQQSKETTTTELVFVGGLTRRNGLVHFVKALERMDSKNCNFSVTFLDTPESNPDVQKLICHFVKNTSITCRLMNFPSEIASLIDYLNSQNRIAVTLPVHDCAAWTASAIHHTGLPCITAPNANIGDTNSNSTNLVVSGIGVSELVATLTNLPSMHRIGAKYKDSTSCYARLIPSPITSDFRTEILEAPASQITVCLSHFCRPHMLHLALESLCNQTVKGFEVVVVDDGSPLQYQPMLDSVCLHFTSRLNLQLIKTDNQYLGACRNTGWRNAKGQFILFMDDDNIATANEIETFSRAQATSKCDVLTCFSDTFMDEENPGLLPTVKNRITPIGACLSIGTLFNCFGDSNSFWRKTTLEDINGFTEIHGVGKDDNEIFARAILNGHTLSVVPERLFYYRLSKNRMRHHHLNPEAGTYRVIEAYRQSCGGDVADLTNLIVGQHQKINQLQQEILAHRSLSIRSEQRIKIIEHLLERIQGQSSNPDRQDAAFGMPIATSGDTIK